MTRPNHPEALSWPKLRAGDRVRLVAPASYPEGSGTIDVTIDDLIHVLSSWALEVEVGKYVLGRHSYMDDRA